MIIIKRIFKTLIILSLIFLCLLIYISYSELSISLGNDGFASKRCESPLMLAVIILITLIPIIEFLLKPTLSDLGAINKRMKMIVALLIYYIFTLTFMKYYFISGIAISMCVGFSNTMVQSWAIDKILSQSAEIYYIPSTLYFIASLICIYELIRLLKLKRGINYKNT